jgi:hypothetical protein
MDVRSLDAVKQIFWVFHNSLLLSDEVLFWVYLLWNKNIEELHNVHWIIFASLYIIIYTRNFVSSCSSTAQQDDMRSLLLFAIFLFFLLFCHTRSEEQQVCLYRHTYGSISIHFLWLTPYIVWIHHRAMQISNCRVRLFWINFFLGINHRSTRFLPTMIRNNRTSFYQTVVNSFGISRSVVWIIPFRCICVI